MLNPFWHVGVLLDDTLGERVVLASCLVVVGPILPDA